MREARVEQRRLLQARQRSSRGVESRRCRRSRRRARTGPGCRSSGVVADDLELLGPLALLELDGVDAAVAADLDLGADRQGVDDRHADAVQAAGDRVGLLVELAAGVQLGQHDLDGRDLLLLVDLHGDAAAVVGDLDPAVGEDRDGDARAALAGEVLVDGVVDHLPDEVVQARGHRWSRCTCPGACGRPRGPRGR